MRVHRGVGLTALAVLLLGLGVTGRQSSADCSPDGNVKFICGIEHAEDLAIIPGSEWVVASGMEGLGLRIVNRRDFRYQQVFPVAEPRIRFDKKTYASCPGPTADKAYEAHSINIREGQNGVHTLYVVHNTSRGGTRGESIEVFEINAQENPPAFTWVGCVLAPPSVKRGQLNAVSPLPGNGFVASNFNWPGESAPKYPEGWTNGEVLEWNPAAGWTVVPGSEFPGPNSLEASKDGAWLFIDQWPAKRVIRLSRGQTPVKKDVIDVPFLPDNIHWSEDGHTLLVAGQGGENVAGVQTCMAPGHFGKECAAPNMVARIDPKTLHVSPVVSYRARARMAVVTVGLQVGREIWLSSDFFDRIVRVPLP